MKSDQDDLSSLRARIDAIDGEIARKLAERMEVVAAIGNIKKRTENGGLALRPAREADIIRRLVKQNEDRFPTAALVRIWRELLSATTRAQSRLLPVIVDGSVDLRTIADHFGSPSEPLIVANEVAALKALDANDADIAIIAIPRAQDRWWLELTDWREQRAAGTPELRVVGRLPFHDRGAPPDRLFWVVAALPIERSDEDRTVIAIETDAMITARTLLDRLRPHGLDARWHGGQENWPQRRTLHCLDIEGFADDLEATVGEILNDETGGHATVSVIGGYASPIMVP
jgi:chorismate mutase